LGELNLLENVDCAAVYEWNAKSLKNSFAVFEQRT